MKKKYIVHTLLVLFFLGLLVNTAFCDQNNSSSICELTLYEMNQDTFSPETVEARPTKKIEGQIVQQFEPICMWVWDGSKWVWKCF